MSLIVDRFLELRPSLREVQETDDGWILAFLDVEPQDRDRVTLLTDLHNEGVIAEVRRGEHRLYPPAIEGGGRLSLRIDTGKLPGYFETYDSLIKTNPDSAPEELLVWEKNESFSAGYDAACTLIALVKSKAEVWDATERRIFLVDQQALEIPL